MRIDTYHPPQHPVNYLTLNAVRGLSAVMVVAFHAGGAARERLGGGAPDILEGIGHGVDVFFVISGFVMVVSSRNLARHPEGWRIFLRRRLVRIVPMYWLMTTVMLGLSIALPGLVHHAAPSWTNIVASCLFIPSRDAAGEIRPVLADGWTLSFEMMFYLLFALALRLRVTIFALTVPVFTVLAVVAMVRRADWPAWTSLARELPFEFVFGAVIGTFAARGQFLVRTLALLGLVIAGPALILLPVGPVISRTTGVGEVSLRLLTVGVPAMILVACVVALEIPIRERLPRWLLALGDGSYAIYLSHSFVIAALTALAARFAKGHVDFFIVTSVVAATMAGMILYYLVEAPMQARLKRLLSRGEALPGAHRMPVQPASEFT